MRNGPWGPRARDASPATESLMEVRPAPSATSTGTWAAIESPGTGICTNRVGDGAGDANERARPPPASRDGGDHSLPSPTPKIISAAAADVGGGVGHHHGRGSCQATAAHLMSWIAQGAKRLQITDQTEATRVDVAVLMSDARVRESGAMTPPTVAVKGSV